MNKIKSIYYNIIYGVKNLIIWFPIIWKDRNWDYVYLFQILQFKISLMRKRQEDIKFYIGYEKDVKNMKICELLLDRIIADDYFYNERLKYLNNHCKNKKIYLNFLQNLEKQDMDLLFKILNKQSKKWWD